MTTTPKNAKEAGFKRITVAELQQNDFFSIDGKAFFIFSSVEEIGAGLVSIHYLSTKKWASYEQGFAFVPHHAEQPKKTVLA